MAPPVGLGSRLIGPDAIPFVPTDLATLAWWLRADLGQTPSGGPLSGWADQSGVGDVNENASQATSGSRPTVIASDSAWNHRTSLALASASNQFMSTGFFHTAPPVTTSGITVFVVGNTDGTSSAQVFIDDFNAFATMMLSNGSSASEISLNCGAALSATIGAGALAGPSIMAFQYKAGASTNKLYWNAKTPVATGSCGSGQPSSFAIGSTTGGAQSLNGKVLEYAMFKALLDSADMNSMWGYLGSRYNVSIGA
jgi:hypothetical protein